MFMSHLRHGIFLQTIGISCALWLIAKCSVCVHFLYSPYPKRNIDFSLCSSTPSVTNNERLENNSLAHGLSVQSGIISFYRGSMTISFVHGCLLLAVDAEHQEPLISLTDEGIDLTSSTFSPVLSFLNLSI